MDKYINKYILISLRVPNVKFICKIKGYKKQKFDSYDKKDTSYNVRVVKWITKSNNSNAIESLPIWFIMRHGKVLSKKQLKVFNALY